MPDFKTINDTIYGSIRVEGVVLDLLETLEIQRLSGIRQLGLTYLVFPGANHSRIEHALGVSHVAGRISQILNLPDEEKDLVTATALLHDVGHGPFSHTLEHVLKSELNMDHVQLTQKIIRGEEDNVSEEERRAFPQVKRIPEVLEKHGVDPKDVANLIAGYEFNTLEEKLSFYESKTSPSESGYLAQMIHSAVDADQIDYLMRDAHYTGVAHGIIDFDRLIQTFTIFDNDLVVDKKGLSAIEGMLVARALMYSSVYFHKTVRIAELMLARAVERAKGKMADIQKMVDAELLSWLIDQGGHQRDIAFRIKYRKLFKKVLVKGKEELSEEQKAKLLELRDPIRRRWAEDSICRRAGVPEGKAIIDMPLPELFLSEPRIGKTEIKVLDGDKIQPFRKMSPLSRALQMREISDWTVMVSADPKFKQELEKVAEKVIFG